MQACPLVSSPVLWTEQSSYDAYHEEQDAILASATADVRSLAGLLSPILSQDSLLASWSRTSCRHAMLKNRRTMASLEALKICSPIC